MGSLWNRSGVIERYGADDLPARNSKAYFFLGNTTTPLTVFADAGESEPHQHPVVADSTGRWPNIFVPFILSYDVLVTNQFDVELTYTREIPNINPVDPVVTPPPGGGGGGTGTGTMPTGMITAAMVQGGATGYVRLNGRTIGNSSSPATERANDDTSALFEHLWNSMPDSIAPVSGGRGGSAAADFTAGKTITLPVCQGAALIGLDDMGAAPGGFFTGIDFSAGDGTTPGSSVGAPRVTLDLAHLPVFTAQGITAVAGDAEPHQHNFASNLIGGSQFHPNLSFSRLVSFYIKL
jgi:hypothetical protein